MLVIIGTRFRLEASVAFVQNGSMPRKAVCAKGGVAAHRRALMHRLTKAEMSSNVPLID